MAKVVGVAQEMVLRCTCSNCASIIEYVPFEVKSFVHRDYGGGSDTVYYIDCPSCFKQIQGVKVKKGLF